MIKFCNSVLPDMDRVAFYLKESFEKNHISNFGPAYNLLTQRLREFLELSDSKDILLTTSGHTALMAAYRALECTKLFIPAYTFASTNQAAVLQGIHTFKVDVNPNTGCLDKLPKYPHGTPDGIVGVAALSTIPNLEHLSKQAADLGAVFILDAAATFGTPRVANTPFADAVCLSFHATKTFPIGECGGLIASKDVIDKARQYINFGFNKERIPQFTGMNAKVSDYTCAIGLALLEKMPEAIKLRNRNRDIYESELGEWIPESFIDDTTYQSMPIFFWNDFYKARLVRQRLQLAGVEILQYYRPLEYLSNTEMLYQTNICLPCHQNLTEEEIRFICKVIKTT